MNDDIAGYGSPLVLYIPELTPESVTEIMGSIAAWSIEHQGEPIVLVFNTDSEAVLEGLRLHDFVISLRMRGHSVTCWAIGMLGTAAMVAMQAGDRRVVSPHAFCELSRSSVQMEEDSDNGRSNHSLRRLMDTLTLNVLAVLDAGARAMIESFFKERRCWLNSSEILSFGLADEIDYCLPAGVASDEACPLVLGFCGDVGALSACDVIRTLIDWSRTNAGQPLTLVIHSVGGSVTDGLALFDVLRALSSQGHEITTWGHGAVCSVAVAIFEAGDRRKLTTNCITMIHEVSARAISGKTSGVETTLYNQKLVEDVCFDIISAQSTLSKSRLRKMCLNRDLWRSAQEFVGMGLADEVDDGLPIVPVWVNHSDDEAA